MAVRAGRSVRPCGTERRRQEHADGHSGGGAAAGCRIDDAGRPAVRAGRSAGGAARRRRDDLSGALACSAPQRGGEHRAGRRARALRDPRSTPHQAHGCRCSRAAGPSGNFSGRARGGSVACRPAAGRDCACPGHRRARAGVRRAHQQPLARGRQEAVRFDRRSEAAGPRHRLHLAFHRGSEGRFGSICGAPGRAQRRRRRHAADAGRRDCESHGGPHAAGFVSAKRAHAGRRHSRGRRSFAGLGHVHAASRRDPRHRRLAGRGADAVVEDGVWPRACAERPRKHGGVFRPVFARGSLAAGNGHAERRSDR